MRQTIDFLILGGPVIWLLIIFSLVATTFTLLKLWQFWVARSRPPRRVSTALQHLENNETAQAVLLLNGQRDARSQVIVKVVELVNARQLDFEQIKVEAMRFARQQVARLSIFLRPLEVIATIAPLLGLFGTVLGMIDAFRAMEAAGAQVNPAVLSGGIWKALLTTAAGLAVAIPVSLIHSWFERRVELQATAIQDDLERLLTLEAQQGIGTSTIKSKSRHA